MNRVEESTRFLVFTLDEQGYALCLDAVDRIVRMAAVTALPGAPESVVGIINLRGEILPVVDLRSRFRLAPREPGLGGRIVIARTSRRRVALIVDEVTRVIQESGDRLIRSDKLFSGIPYIEGIVKLENGLLLIQDLEKLLSLEEEGRLREALNDREAPNNGENGS